MATSAVPLPGEPDFFSRQTTQAKRFWLDLAPSASAPLVVTCGGKEHCGADYAIHRADFRFYVVEFVVQGRGSVTLQRRTYPLGPGMLFTYGPRVSQDILSDPADALVKFFVSFSGRDARRLLVRCGLHPGTVLQTRAPGDITALFDDLIRNGLGKTPFSAEITATVTRHLLFKIAETGAPPGVPDLPSFATYLRCREYMDAHWADIEKLHDVAHACGIEAAYMCRLFKRFDHHSPHQYLLSLRMNEAAQRLARPDATVKEIASSLGFTDQFHFSRVFKSFYGVAPRVFARGGLHHR